LCFEEAWRSNPRKRVLVAQLRARPVVTASRWPKAAVPQHKAHGEAVAPSVEEVVAMDRHDLTPKPPIEPHSLNYNVSSVFNASSVPTDQPAKTSMPFKIWYCSSESH
jgi:hypothetical protein